MWCSLLAIWGSACMCRDIHAGKIPINNKKVHLYIQPLSDISIKIPVFKEGFDAVISCWHSKYKEISHLGQWEYIQAKNFLGLGWGAALLKRSRIIKCKRIPVVLYQQRVLKIHPVWGQGQLGMVRTSTRNPCYETILWQIEQWVSSLDLSGSLALQ